MAEDVRPKRSFVDWLMRCFGREPSLRWEREPSGPGYYEAWGSPWDNSVVIIEIGENGTTYYIGTEYFDPWWGCRYKWFRGPLKLSGPPEE